MKLQIDKNKGYVVIDDNTGRIISILVKGVEGKTDFRAFTSYKREGKKHFDIRTKPNKKAYNKSSQ